jgi:hypothetical protein
MRGIPLPPEKRQAYFDTWRRLMGMTLNEKTGRWEMPANEADDDLDVHETTIALAGAV